MTQWNTSTDNLRSNPYELAEGELCANTAEKSGIYAPSAKGALTAEIASAMSTMGTTSVKTNSPMTPPIEEEKMTDYDQIIPPWFKTRARYKSVAVPKADPVHKSWPYAVMDCRRKKYVVLTKGAIQAGAFAEELNRVGFLEDCI